MIIIRVKNGDSHMHNGPSTTETENKVVKSVSQNPYGVSWKRCVQWQL